MPRVFGLLLLLILATGRGAGAQAPAEPLRIALSRDLPARFVVSGLAPEMVDEIRRAEWSGERWQEALSVRLTGTPPRPPLLGTYAVQGSDLIFTPSFPVDAGRIYDVTLRPSRLPGGQRGAADVQVTVASAKKTPLNQPATTISLVTPTVSVLPENQLKFYLHFSAPMSRGEAYRHITLRTEAGEVVAHPFLELPEELWDPELRRFTLLLDPGRIKRGLKPREQFGPPLETGRAYTLEISADWLDANGRPLAAPLRKAFRVADPDDTQPNVERWKIQWPTQATRQPVTIEFDEPLDHGLLQRMIWIVDAEDRVLTGDVRTSDHDRRWEWTPDASWQPGRYRLVIDTRLEDLAGNSLARPFEVDLFETVEREVTRKTQELEFTIR